MHPYRGWPFLADTHHADLSAAWSVLMHGSIGVLVVWPIIARTRRRALGCALAFIGAVAVDVDHAAAAGSASPAAMEHLSRRPDAHSLVLALAVGVLALAFTRDLRFGWAAFAVIASHLITDAAGGADRLLYPFSKLEAVPWLLCPLVLLALGAGSFALSRRGGPGRDARAGPAPG